MHSLALWARSARGDFIRVPFPGAQDDRGRPIHRPNALRIFDFRLGACIIGTAKKRYNPLRKNGLRLGA
jgi:hypothetical protein